MTWTIQYSNNAQRFIQLEDIHDEITSQLRKVLIKLSGEPTNVDLKKLIGDWKGYYRVKKGKLRIIVELNKGEKILFVEKIDYRGDVYK